MTSLREQLGMKAEPDFDLRLPPGWKRFSVTSETEQAFQKRLNERMRSIGRPDLLVGLQNETKSTFKNLRDAGAFAFFAPDGDEESTVYVPASLNAVIRRGVGGANLDELVRDAIENRGALPLFGDARVMVFETQKPTQMADTEVVVYSRIYVTPIPGTQRRSALQLTAGWGSVASDPESNELVGKYRELFDVCVSTLRWVDPRHES